MVYIKLIKLYSYNARERTALSEFTTYPLKRLVPYFSGVTLLNKFYVCFYDRSEYNRQYFKFSCSFLGVVYIWSCTSVFAHIYCC